MSSPRLEEFLARLYTDEGLRQQFLHDPLGAATAANLNRDEVNAMCGIDKIGLQLAAVSFESKRAQYRRRRGWAYVFLAKLMRRFSNH
ncbi:MAG TPA: hypothetical protein VIF60_20140 [Burkholderiaceae bacterium]|jgi:hypothetical protein